MYSHLSVGLYNLKFIEIIFWMCKSKAKNTATNSNSNVPIVNQSKVNGPVVNSNVNVSGIQPSSTNPAGINQMVVPGAYQSGIGSNQLAPLR